MDNSVISKKYMGFKMKFKRFFLFVLIFYLLFLQLDCCWAVDRKFEELTRLYAREAEQGVAVDENFIYAIGTNEIGKYDKKTYQKITSWGNGGRGRIIHLNSGLIHDGKLYCAHSNYPQIPMISSVEIWDTHSLQHIASHSFGLEWGSCTWIDRHKGYWWGVFAHYEKITESLNKDVSWTTLLKFDDQWHPLESWVLPEEVLHKMQPMSNSGGTWGPDGLLYCTGHDRSEIYVLQLPMSGSIIELVDSVAIEITGQGIAWDRGNPGVLYGINKKDRQIIETRLQISGIQLRQGNYHSEEEAKKELIEFTKDYTNLAEWNNRAESIREGILRGAQLYPLPNKCPLNPIIHSKRIYRGYSVENIAIESMPGFFITGNLYRPSDFKGSFAAILCPHGHFSDGRFRPDHQLRCATLARMGALVFAYDMVGWGEAKQIENHDTLKSHKQIEKAVALQTWNSTRVIDFLLTLPNVDATRVGVTGASGGGTQTFLLTALDPRISVSVPVVMVSAHFFGGCVCESGMPIHSSAFHKTNNTEIAALAAPRSQLIISCGEDWTKNTPQVEYPYIKNIYKLFNAENKVENLHLVQEGHDYGYSKRMGAYKFLAKHLNLKIENVLDDNGIIDESAVVIEKQSSMLVFDSDHPRPAHTVKFIEW